MVPAFFFMSVASNYGNDCIRVERVEVVVGRGWGALQLLTLGPIADIRKTNVPSIRQRQRASSPLPPSCDGGNCFQEEKWRKGGHGVSVPLNNRYCLVSQWISSMRLPDRCRDRY